MIIYCPTNHKRYIGVNPQLVKVCKRLTHLPQLQKSLRADTDLYDTFMRKAHPELFVHTPEPEEQLPKEVFKEVDSNLGLVTIIIDHKNSTITINRAHTISYIQSAKLINLIKNKKTIHFYEKDDNRKSTDTSIIYTHNRAYS